MNEITTMQLLRAYMDAHGARTDRQAALRLGVRTGQWSAWVAGMRPVPDAMVVRLARGAGIDPAFALVSVHAERAEDEETAAAWRAAASHLAA